MFQVTIHDLDGCEARRIDTLLTRSHAEGIEKELTEENNMDVSFYCKSVCYESHPLDVYFLNVNNETMILKRYDFSFIAIS